MRVLPRDVLGALLVLVGGGNPDGPGGAGFQLDASDIWVRGDQDEFRRQDASNIGEFDRERARGRGWTPADPQRSMDREEFVAPRDLCPEGFAGSWHRAIRLILDVPGHSSWGRR